MANFNDSTDSGELEENLDNESKKKLDKIYNDLEHYLEDYDFKSYIAPLMNPNTFTVEKIHNLTKVLQYYKDEGIFLPLIDDPRYKFIENYKNFEFTNCIAYEMAIRTDEFQKVKFLFRVIENIENMQNMYSSSYHISNDETKEFINTMKESLQYLHKEIRTILLKHLDSYNVQINLNELLKKILADLFKELDSSKLILKDLGILNPTLFLSQDMIDFTGDNFTLLDQIQRTPTIADFSNGLELLIKFYLPKEKIYKKVDDDVKFERIVNSIDNEIQTIILKNIDSYYINVNSSVVQLSSNMSISMFDKEFQNILKKHYKKYQYIDTQPNYTRPSLHFINARIINLPINLNFSRDELKCLILKIKDDYDHKKSLVKTPIELLGEELEKFQKPNSEQKLPVKKMKEKKIAFAHAFCVYDLDKVLSPIFDKKYKDFKEKQKKGQIDKDEINEYSKEYLKSEISSITGLSEDSVKVYRTLMKEYIDQKKFTELIQGFSKSKY